MTGSGPIDAPATNAAFDGDHPPAASLIDQCVHCGFCLPTCPTYLLWGEEMDSPRGRIYLMRSGLDGRAGMTPGFVRHLDACLGCMACVTACPSGVQYGPLIEATRGQIERRHPRPFGDRLFRRALFSLFPYPGRLRIALAPLALWSALPHRRSVSPAGAVDRRPGTPDHQPKHEQRDRQPPAGDLGLMPRLRAIFALAPRVTWQSLVARVPERTPAVGSPRLTVGLLTGCVQRIVFPNVNAASVNVLAAEGCDVIAPRDQGCCGALALHAGRLTEARRFARRTIATFESAGVELVAVNAAGCGSSMKEYGQLLAGDAQWADRARAFAAKVRDISEVLTGLGPPAAPRRRLSMRVAYHDACHLAHAQVVRQQPRDLLRSIPGIELVPIAEAEICCGSAGIYNLVEPTTAEQLGDRKIGHLAAAEPDVIATGNPGCTLQLAAAARRLGRRWPIRHPIEILDEAIRAR
jgi:glycolate dehydrogenase iron-sulfur subunit